MNVKLKPEKRDILLLISVLLVIILLKLPSLFEPHWNSQEGFYSAVANTFKFGRNLYKDIHTNQNPGIFYFYYLANLTSNFSLVLLKTLNLIFSIGSGIFLYKLGKKLFSRRIGYASIIISTFFLGLPLINTNITLIENITLFFNLSAIYLALQKDWKSYILSGLLFGISSFLSFKVIFELFLIVFFLICEKRKCGINRTKKLLFFLTGLAVPLLTFTAYLGSLDLFNNFYDLVIVHNVNEITNTPSNSLGFIFFPNTFITRSIFTSILVLLVVFLYKKSKISYKYTFLALWLILSSYSAMLFQKSDLNYLISIIPPFSILTSIIVRKIKNNSDCILLINSLALYVLSIFFILNLFAGNNRLSSNINSIDYYVNFFQYLTKKIDTSSYIKSFSLDTYQTYRFRNYLIQNFPDDKNIYIWTDNPWIYKLAEIDPPTRFLRSDQADVNFSVTQQELEKANPNLIIIDKNSYSSGKISQYILDNNYEFFREFEGYAIYLKNGKNLAND